jgi:hypothetical protein
LDDAWRALDDPHALDAKDLASQAESLVPDEDAVTSEDELLRANAWTALSYLFESLATRQVEPVEQALGQMEEAAEVLASAEQASCAMADESGYGAIENSDRVRAEQRDQLADAEALEHDASATAIANRRHAIQFRPRTVSRRG